MVIDVDEMNGDMLVDQEDDREENEDVIESDQSTPTLEDGLEKTSIPDGRSSNSIADSGLSSLEEMEMGKLYDPVDNNSYRLAQKKRFPVPVELKETQASNVIPSGSLNDDLGKGIQDMLPVNDIKKLPSKQIPNMLSAVQIHDIKEVAAIEQGTSRTQEEQFDMFTAKQQSKYLEPAERVAKLEPAENNANFLQTEQTQEIILAEQKKNLLIANDILESLTEEYHRFFIPPEQSQKRSPIGQSRDMFQDKTIQDIPDNKVKRNEEVLKNSPDLELDHKKEKIKLEYMKKRILMENVSKQEGSSSPTNDYPYSCGLCHFKTRYEQSLNRHIRLKHENMPLLQCDYCDFGSKDKYSLKRHYRLMHLEDLNQSNPKLPTCDMCGETSLDENELVNHKKTAHDFTVVDYKCSDCSFVSQRHDCLNKHQRTIHRNMEFTCCWKCTQSFYRKIDFKEHLCPSETASVKCHICSKMLSSPKCLQAHNQLHYGHHKHRCEICNDTFLKRFQLMRHINIKHEDNTMRYSCRECSSSFLYKASLARHVKAAHTIKQEDKTMRYSCKECTSSFLYKSNLARHIKAAHENQIESHIERKNVKKPLISAKEKNLPTENQLKNYVCPKCTSFFVFKGGLIRHIQKKHPQTISTDSTEESTLLKV